jgi:cyclase
MNAPYHYGPETDGSEALTIDKVPLAWCFGPGVLLDVRGASALAIDVDEITSELRRIGHTVTAGDIVMFRTGADERFDGDPAYPASGRGLTRDALVWLVEQGVKVIGTDAESLDRPLPDMLSDARIGNTDSFFPVHRAAREFEHCQLLKLGNLSALPMPTGYYIWAPPIKIEGAGSGWVRAVALVPGSST